MHMTFTLPISHIRQFPCPLWKILEVFSLESAQQKIFGLRDIQHGWRRDATWKLENWVDPTGVLCPPRASWIWNLLSCYWPELCHMPIPKSISARQPWSLSSSSCSHLPHHHTFIALTQYTQFYYLLDPNSILTPHPALWQLLQLPQVSSCNGRNWGLQLPPQYPPLLRAFLIWLSLCRERSIWLRPQTHTESFPPQVPGGWCLE
jgi:hypothetical protein